MAAHVAFLFPADGPPRNVGEESRTSSPWTSSRYEPPRSRFTGAVVAAAITAAIIVPLAFMHAGHHHHHRHGLRLLDLHEFRPRPDHPHPHHHHEPLARHLSMHPRTTPALAVPVAVPPIVNVPAPPVAIAAPAAPVLPPATSAAPSVAAASHSDDLSSNLISATPPTYPEVSRRLREQGTVVLFVTLGENGRVEAVEVRQSSGSARLDTAALNAVRRWRWTATQVNGEAVKVAGLVKIPFVLRS